MSDVNIRIYCTHMFRRPVNYNWKKSHKADPPEKKIKNTEIENKNIYFGNVNNFMHFYVWWKENSWTILLTLAFDYMDQIAIIYTFLLSHSKRDEKESLLKKKNHDPHCNIFTWTFLDKWRKVLITFSTFSFIVCSARKIWF